MATAKPKKSEAEKNLCRIITPEFRVSYPHVYKPQAAKKGDKLKYSITMLYPKDSDLMGSAPDGTPRSLKDVIKSAKVIEFGGGKETWPVDLQSPVSDGDVVGKDKATGEMKEGYAGHWVIKATTGEDQRPGVVGRDGKALPSEGDLYPGCYARAYIYAYVWEYMGKQGVGFILDHVQKLRDGKNLGGKKPVDQVFGNLGAGPAADIGGGAAEADDFR